VFAMVALGVLFHALAQLRTRSSSHRRPSITAKLLIVELLRTSHFATGSPRSGGSRHRAGVADPRRRGNGYILFVRVRFFLDEAVGAPARPSYLWKGAGLLLCCGLPVLGLRLSDGDRCIDRAAAVFLTAYCISLWFWVVDTDDRDAAPGRER